MAALEMIPIPCWVCGKTFRAPATMTILPPQYMPGDFTAQQASANVWIYVDNAPIRAHVQSHWPMIVVLYLWWLGFVEVAGFDPLEWYAARQPTP